MVCLGVLAALSLVGWVALLMHPARPWDMRPVAEDEPAAPPPAAWPAVVVVVPARNEAETLPGTLPSLLAQDYPGPLRVIVVDDRSGDGTADAARGAAPPGEARIVTIVTVDELQAGWAGKVWAMQRGLDAAGALEESGADGPRWVLLTDADIRHAPQSVRLLVAESERDGLALCSRMARLSCESPAERWLIPAFAYFFAVMYPMRRVNDPRSRVAAAAGGCMLVRCETLRAMGGLEPIRDRIIDDVALAAAIRSRGGAIRLARSERDVVSVRRYPLARDIWSMVRRTAFTQLRESWVLLVACLLALTVAFVAPVAATLLGLLAALSGDVARGLVLLALGGGAWAASARTYAVAVRRFGLASWRAWTLPFAGVAYAGMTLDSALRGPSAWRS